MGRSSQEKINYAVKLIKVGKTFREIQEILKKKFNSSMSFSTLSKLKQIQSKGSEESEKVSRLEQELSLFKKLYFDLLENVNNSKKNPSKDKDGDANYDSK